MNRYKIKVHVELVECDDAVNNELTKNNDGRFSMAISEQDALRIDMYEKFVLQRVYPPRFLNHIQRKIDKLVSDISRFFPC